MTERTLPAIAIPSPARGRSGEDAAALGIRGRPASLPRTATATREALVTTPARAGILLGASAAVYAVTLAGISVLQAHDDAATVARHQPYVDVLARQRAANDELEAAVRQADQQVHALGGWYTQTGDRLAAYEARLDALAALVADVQGTAAALPARISLPAVNVRTSVGSAPRTSATSGASGVP
jgi:hypothetical protein